MAMIGLVFSGDIVFDGLVQGLVYALVAFGLLLIYRATGVINFAHGQIGAFGGYLMAVLQIRYDIAFGLSLPLALLAGLVLGVVSELVLRRLFTQPRLLLFVATLGLTQVIQLLQLRIPITDEEATQVGFPVLISGQWEVAGLSLTGPQVQVLLVVPALMVFLGWLFHKSAFGMQVRATADNFSAAQLAGIGVRKVSTKVWALAGVLATLSVLLITPLYGGSIGSVQTALGPKLLLLSLVAAMVGRMKSFGWTLVGGLVAGLIDRLLVSWSLLGQMPAGANVAVLFVILLVVLFTTGRGESMRDSGWQLTNKVRAARVELTRHPLYRALTLGGMALLAGVALIVPSQLDKASDVLKFSIVPIYLIVALSVTVVTGWGGQLSLGQFGFVALGSYSNIYFADELPYWLSIIIGIGFGVGAAIIIGIPALRVKGLYLAVITLGFGLMIRSWFLVAEKVAPDGGGVAKLNVDRAKGFRLLFWEVKGKNFDGIYYFTLFIAVLVILLVWRIRRTGIGRSIIATRDNENSAAAYTVSPNRAKLLAFAVSGGIAALAGALLPLADRSGQFKVDGLAFEFEDSLRIVAVAVVGGIGSITGAILGTLVIVALPLVFDGTEQVELFASGFGMLIVLLYFPSGLISILHSFRDNLLGWIARRTNWTPPVREKGADVASLGGKGNRCGSHRGSAAHRRTHREPRWSNHCRRSRHSRASRRDRRSDRYQRSGQDHHSQRGLRSPSVHRTGRTARARHFGDVGSSPSSSGSGSRVPEREIVRLADRARDPDGRPRIASAVAPDPVHPRVAAVSDRRTTQAPRGRRDHQLSRARSLRGLVDGRVVHRYATHRGAGGPHRPRLEAVAPRRADRRCGPTRDRSVRSAHPDHPARIGGVDPDHRARHADGDVHLGPHLLPRGRSRHRRG
jgi:ABC-type branched-subunit amino acid transport system permease subunit